MKYFRIWFDGLYDDNLHIDCPYEQFIEIFKFIDSQAFDILKIDVFSFDD